MENRDMILLVDDNRDLCESLKCYLERNGLMVHTVYNGADAYDAIHELHPGVIVLDVEMPELDGFQLAMMLQKEGNTIPVLFMSGNHEADAAQGKRIKIIWNKFSKSLSFRSK